MDYLHRIEISAIENLSARRAGEGILHSISVDVRVDRQPMAATRPTVFESLFVAMENDLLSDKQNTDSRTLLFYDLQKIFNYFRVEMCA